MTGQPVVGVAAPRTVRRNPSRSAAVMLGTSFAVALLSLWNVVVTSRGLGVSGRGQVAFLMTVGTLTSNMATIGVQEANANVAGQAPHRTAALAGNSVVLATFFGGLASLLLLGLVALSPALGGHAPRWLLWLVLACMPGLVLHVYLQQLALAHYKFGVINSAALLTPLLNASVNTVLALRGTLSVSAAVCTWLLGQLLATALYAVVVGRSLGGFGRPDAALARSSLAFGAKAHVGRTLSWGSYRMDQWVVGVVGGDRMLGLYNVAVAWSEALFLLPQVLQTVLRPDLVRAGRTGAQRQTILAMRFGVLLTIPTALLVVVFAPFLCVTLLDGEFQGAVLPLRLLTIGSVGVVAIKVYGAALLAQGRPMLDTVAVAPALVVMLALDLLLVPVLGVVGAAVASSTSYLVGGGIAVILGLKVLGGRAGELMPRPADVRALFRMVRQWRPTASATAP
ncbi:MAG: polysaccharide biosynthesis protein [Frankiales bacterium]|nr:polysaccharide biosynthesis protein [Frankiales bacterium]